MPLAEKFPVLRVMISSTTLDLADCRKAAWRAIDRAKCFAVRMEGTASEAGVTPLTYSLNCVDESDVYVGIFAGRYGGIPEKDNPAGWSFTEWEYRRALERNIPALIFVAAESYTAPHADKEPPASAAKLKRLRDLLKAEHVVGTFDSAAKLGDLIYQSLMEYRLKAEAAAKATSDPPTPAAKSAKKRWLWVSALLFVVVTAGVFVALRSERPSRQADPVPPKAGDGELKTFPVRVSANRVEIPQAAGVRDDLECVAEALSGLERFLDGRQKDDLDARAVNRLRRRVTVVSERLPAGSVPREIAWTTPLIDVHVFAELLVEDQEGKHSRAGRSAGFYGPGTDGVIELVPNKAAGGATCRLVVFVTHLDGLDAPDDGALSSWLDSQPFQVRFGR